MFDKNQKQHYQQLTEIEQSRQKLISDPKLDPEKIVDQIAHAAKRIQESQPPSGPRQDAVQVLRGRAGTATRGSPEELASGPELLSAQTTGIEVRALMRMTHVPTAHVHVYEPGENPLVTFELENHSDRPVRLRVQSYIEGYSARAVETVEIPKQQSQARAIHQLPTLFPEPVRSVREATRATLHVEVDDLDARGAEHQIEEHKTFRLWLLPKTTAILLRIDPSTGERYDMKEYLVCWVTPNATSVMQCLREAADRTRDKMMVGYQVDAAGVEEQVRAIYQTIKARKLTYVNSVLAVGADDLFVQRIRLPRESLEHRSANCIDGAVLYASVMEAASLSPAIVLIPGHAFVAWRVQRNGAWNFLETTMTGSHEFDRAKEMGSSTVKRLEQQGTSYNILDVANLRGDGYLPLE